MPELQTQPHDGQHDDPGRHVQAVKSGHGIEGCAERAARVSELIVSPQKSPLVPLETEKDYTQNDRRQGEPTGSFAAAAGQQAVRPFHGRGTGHENEGRHRGQRRA